MATKSAVTLLQELTQSKNLASPVYFLKEVEGPKFKCTLQVGGEIFEGVSTTKREAECEGAQIALTKLQTSKKPQQTESNQKSSRNYVGELSEYATKHRVAYPVYDLLPTTIKTGEFIVDCSFLGCEALGKGKNKKEAKQNAARNMIELYVNQGKCEVEAYQRIIEDSNTKNTKEENSDVSNAEQNSNEAKTKNRLETHVSGVPDLVNFLAETEKCEKSEVIGWSAQEFEKIVANINALGINRKTQSRSGPEEDNKKSIVKKECGDVCNAKAKKKKAIKKEGGDVSNEIDTNGAKKKKKADEEGKKKTPIEANSAEIDTNGAKKKRKKKNKKDVEKMEAHASGTQDLETVVKTMKDGKNEVNDLLGAQGLEKMVATINTLALNAEGQSGSSSKPAQIQIVINLQK